jgi:pyridoxine 4-dehydrogenase
MTMYLGGDSRVGAEQSKKLKDTTSVGTLTVPSVGVGTISWSSDSLTELENLELQSLVDTACASNAAFFDTAERYGGNLKTALGLGWGETEMLTKKLLDRSKVSNSALKPVVATKFTPSP